MIHTAHVTRSLAINSEHMPGLLVAGGPKGEVTLYSLPTASGSDVPITAAAQTFAKAHGRCRVSCVRVRSTDEFVTVGRDGKICSFQRVLSPTGVGSGDSVMFELSSTGRLSKSLEMVEGLLTAGRQGEEFAQGFKGVNMVVAGTSSEVGRLLEVECGGLHRAFHFRFFPDPSCSLETQGSHPPLLWFYGFAFIFQHRLNLAVSSLASTPDACSRLVDVELQEAFHGTTCNDLLFSGTHLVTGSEDKCLRLYVRSPDSCTQKPSLRLLQVLKGQMSSVRCITTSKRTSCLLLPQYRALTPARPSISLSYALQRRWGALLALLASAGWHVCDGQAPVVQQRNVEWL